MKEFWFAGLILVTTIVLICFCAINSLANETFMCRNNNFKDSINLYKGDVNGQCVVYVRYETEILYDGFNGEAWSCYDKARIYGYSVGSVPKEGSIIVFNKVPGTALGVGHVGIVKSVNGNNVTIRDSNWVADYTVGEHTIDVTSYDILGYIYCDGVYNKMNFTFPSGSSEGMAPNGDMTEAPLGSSYNEWRTQVSGSDPGVDSPSYPAGLLAKNIVIEFAAKAITGDDHPVSEGQVYVKDENNSWNNLVPLQLINGEVGYNNGQFAVDNYNVYRAVLSEMTRSEAQMRQFSIQLTNGHSTSETWTFD